jgi:hypothetical protein
VLKKFLRREQNEFDTKIKKIRSNNDTEFKNTQLEDFLDEEGIKHEFSAPLYYSIKWGSRKEEPNSHRDDKSHA